MNKARQLNEIHSKWFKDCVCELQKTATQPVPGVGNPEARIVFCAVRRRPDCRGVCVEYTAPVISRTLFEWDFQP